MFKDQIISVSLFNKIAHEQLVSLGEFTVEGEISQLQISQGKWLFMTIKDDQASVNVFAPVFKISAASILEEGMKVHVHGTASLYQKTGRFSINAWQIVPAGDGALKLAYEKLKQKLQAEGLFDSARKRQISKFPEEIALLTAPQARAYSDFLKIINSRRGGMKIYFYPIQVQGKLAVESIINAFKYLNQSKLNLDAIVLTRGGGSLEDLLAFNDEQVARAVFASKYPVISAIGHEEDVALTDLVADLRASTPTNAAEKLTADRRELLLEIDSFAITMERYLLTTVDSLKQTAELTRTRLSQLLDLLLKDQRQQLHSLNRLLKSFDPQKILERGYSMTTLNGRLLHSIKEVKKNDMLITQIKDGSFASQIKKIN